MPRTAGYTESDPLWAAGYTESDPLWADANYCVWPQLASKHYAYEPVPKRGLTILPIV